MDLTAPADSLFLWIAVTAFAIAIATGVLKRWALGRSGVRQGAPFEGTFIAVALVVGLLPLVMFMALTKYGGDGVTPGTALCWSGGLMAGLAGLAVLTRATVGDPSRGRRRCAGCWYDMSAISGMQCPECGRTAKSERRLFRTRRRKRGFALAAVLLMTALAGVVAPVVQGGEWQKWVPNAPLMIVLPHVDVKNELVDEFYRRFVQQRDRGDDPYASWDTGWRARLLLSCCRTLVGRPKSPGQADMAVLALGQMSGNSSEAREALYTIALDELKAAQLRCRAFDELAKLSSDRERLTAELVTALDDPVRSVRLAAIADLASISRDTPGGIDVPPRLLEIASGGGGDVSLQPSALRFLGQFRSSDAAADLIIDMLESPDAVVRASAIVSLTGQVTDADRLHPLLLRLSREVESRLRPGVVAMIAEHGPYSDEGVEEMIRIKDLPAAQLSQYAVWLYGKVAQAPFPIDRRIAVLERTLDHEVLRPAGLMAIEQLGSEARPLLPRLKGLKEAFDQHGSSQAEAAVLDRLLWRLDPERQ